MNAPANEDRTKTVLDLIGVIVLVAVAVLTQIPLSGPDSAAYLPGQLEAVNGIHFCPDTVMELRYGHVVEAAFSSSGGVAGGATIGYHFGFVRFSAGEESFQGALVWHLHWVGRTIAHQLMKGFVLDATNDYWVGKDGKIVRQEATKTSVFGNYAASCDYFSDHLEIKSRENGKDRSMTLFPAHAEIDQLNAQFTPMVQDGKILVREKAYLVLDPFRGTFEKRSARLNGTFDGTECGGHFHGYRVEIEGGPTPQGVCVSDDNYLVKVELQNGRSIEMMVLPDHRPKGS